MSLKEPRSSIDRNIANAILGKNLFGPEQWLSSYGIWFSDQQLKEISRFPWNESVLNAPCPFVKGKLIKETHFAFLGMDQIYNKPLDVLKWHELSPITGKKKLKKNPWYKDQNFARVNTCCLKWYWTLIESVPNSTEKTYTEQVELLPSEYRAPFVIEEVTKNILYYKTHKTYPNFNTWIRCREVADIANIEDVSIMAKDEDIEANNCHICVGDFVRIRGWSGKKRHAAVGISAFRKESYSKCRVIGH
jgi:hypothetical protein